jgi:ribonuclease HII
VTPSLVVGIDENGLGPLLGPLVVTGVSFAVDGYDREAVFGLAGPDLPAADSKKLFSPRRPAAAEDAVLRWLDVFRVGATDAAELERAVVLPPPWPAPCPEPMPVPCAAVPLPLPRFLSERPRGLSLGVWNRFDAAKASSRGIAAHSLCAGAFNDALDRVGGNKLRLDFALMMRVARSLARGSERALILCGKVGGTASYSRWLTEEGFEIEGVLAEGRDESRYDVRGLGRLCFVRDGDASHLPIAVASMVGKYLRELAVERLNLALGRDRTSAVSGYRDPVTRRFVEETESSRRRCGMPDACFLRRA